MDQTPLLLLAATSAIGGALLAVAALRRPGRSATAGGPESPFAISTEGMKVCDRCSMGNLWTSRTCSACGAPLKG
jgi:hypothetical protein